MKILIIAAFFPPMNTIGALRPYSWAKNWSKENDVTVICSGKKKTDFDLDISLQGFKVIDFVQSNERAQCNRGVNLISRLKNIQILKKAFRFFCTKTGCFYGIRYPDVHDKWARMVIKYFTEKSEKFDVVISTGGPYSVHRIGLYLKKQGLVNKWIIDWRDLWTKNPYFRGFPLFWLYEKMLENSFHRNCDKIITVSEGCKEILTKQTNKDVITIFNGYDIDDYKSIMATEKIKDSKLRIVYTGNLYGKHRDPSILFLAIKELFEENKIEEGDILVTFAGQNCDLSKKIELIGIKPFFEYVGMLKRSEALKLQYNADILLFLEHESKKIKGILTGKLFEYLFIAEYILALGISENCESGSVIKKSCKGICVKDSVEDVKKFLLKKLEEKRINNSDVFCKADSNYIKQFDRSMLAEKLFSILDT